MLEEITIYPPDAKIKEQVKQKWRTALGSGENFGLLEELTADYLMMTNGQGLRGLKPVMLLMCGDHGICKYGVSAFPQEVTLQMINGYGRGTAGANVLARHGGSDIVVVDVGTNFDLHALSHVRQCKVAWGTEELTTGRGSGINDARLKIKTEVVRKGLEVNRPKQGDGFDVLCKVGGYDHAGLAGMMLAGSAHHVPTMIDGVNAVAAALIAYGINPESAKYMLCSHLSSDASAQKMLETLQLKPVINAGMRLGEGTGASLAISILRTALDTYRDITGA